MMQCGMTVKMFFLAEASPVHKKMEPLLVYFPLQEFDLIVCLISLVPRLHFQLSVACSTGKAEYCKRWKAGREAFERG